MKGRLIVAADLILSHVGSIALRKLNLNTLDYIPAVHVLTDKVILQRMEKSWRKLISLEIVARV